MLSFPFGCRTTLDLRPDGGSVPAANVASLFSFADDFATAGYFAGRTGWRYWSNDVRQADRFLSSGGKLEASNTFPSPGTFATVDAGRTDACFVQAKAPPSGGFQLCGRISDENNFVYVTANVGSNAYTRLFCYAGGVQRGLWDGQVNLAAGDLWRMDFAGDTLTVTVNGARFPSAGATFSVADVPRSGKGGATAGQNYQLGGCLDDLSAGYPGATALVRVTLDPLQRIYQRGRGATTKAVPLAGQHSGLNGAPEMRLLVAATNAVVAGWDWGQKPLTGFMQDTASWSAATAPIPQGDGYRIEVRDPANHDAGSRSNRFGVGIVFVIYGQSNSTGMGGGSYFTPTTPIASIANPVAAGDGQPKVALQAFDTTDRAAGGCARASDALATPAGLPVAGLVGGYGGQPIANLAPGSTFVVAGWTTSPWVSLEQQIAAAGGDVEAFVLIQGETDAGSGGGPNYTPPADYKAALDAIYARMKAITGRSAAQLPFVIHGLGRVANAPAGYDDGGAWAIIRKAQFEWCRDIAGAVLGSTAIDGVMDMSPAWTSPAWHRNGSDAGYGEDGKRIGAALAKTLGYAATDRRGPLPTGMTRSGNALVIAFNPNGTSAMTCAAAIAANFEFATDATFATTLTPTAMAIDNTAHNATFTFAGAPPAGAAVRGPTGINPVVANALKGTAPDGRSIITWPIFDRLVAA